MCCFFSLFFGTIDIFEYIPFAYRIYPPSASFFFLFIFRQHLISTSTHKQCTFHAKLSSSFLSVCIWIPLFMVLLLIFFLQFFFLFIFTFGKNNNEQQSNRIHRNVIWYYFPFYSLYHFLCERYRMQSVTLNTSWLSLSAISICMHSFLCRLCLLFLSFVCFHVRFAFRQHTTTTNNGD